jgi:serine/threonine protein phosphatase PrpC
MPLGALPCGLFVVADGLGGYHDGQEASCGAIQALVDSLWPKLASFNMLEPEACTVLLAEAVQQANEAVSQQNIDLESRIGTQRMEDEGGLDTTLTAAMLIGSTAYVANVGDCRTYLYRASEGLKKVTTDHLWVARQIEAGLLEPDALYTHGYRCVTERALGGKPPVEVDLFTVRLHPGDTLLLCSDGLWRAVRDPKIKDVLGHVPLDPSQAAEALIQSALDGGGPDNVSVIVISMLEAQNQTLVPSVQFFAMPHRLHIPQV